MISVRRSLRFRLALNFAAFGILISLLLSTGLFIAAHNLGVRLMNETMDAEIEDFLARRTRNPQALLPSTITLRGYLFNPLLNNPGAPPELASLPSGEYQMMIDDTPYQILVVFRGSEKFVILYNASMQQNRENTFLAYLLIGIFIMTSFSAWLGWWLAGRIVSPITELARRVGNTSPDDEELDISHGFPEDEVGWLAKVFGNYLLRMRAFTERERAFTADVSHELRTPLTIVQGVAELMNEDDNLDHRQHERIQRISRANKQMIDITAALLIMAREESRDELVMQQCDVWDVVLNSVESHRHLLNAATRIELNHIAPVHVAAERTLLDIVVSNLIRNAFAYTAAGSVTISLHQDRLTITDTGRGISSDEIGKVFNRHYKGIDSTGEGIGLSLVRRICARYDWKTEIQSVVGEGTTAQLIFQSPA